MSRAHGGLCPNHRQRSGTAELTYAWLRLLATSADRHDRQRRYVVLRGGAAGRAGRLRRHAGRRLAPLHARHDRLRHRRRRHRPPRRPLRHRRPADRRHVSLGIGFIASGLAPNILVFSLANFLIGVGSSGAFAPLIADISHWFTRRRGIAVALCASGNYLGGAVWPPIVHHLIEAVGWRQNQIVIGIVCIATMLPLLLALRRRLAAHREDAIGTDGGRPRLARAPPHRPVRPARLAGVSCCVAMSMPQVHIVAYCSDLGYGVARGAEMLSLMLGFGLISRVASGFVADRIGGLATLLIGSIAQARGAVPLPPARRPHARST